MPRKKTTKLTLNIKPNNSLSNESFGDLYGFVINLEDNARAYLDERLLNERNDQIKQLEEMSIINTDQETPEMTAFKKKWVGREVMVTDKSHPHFGAVGEVTGIDHTFAGFGMKIMCTQNCSIFYGEEFYVFKGNQIKLL